jgi:putative peptidoglycan lipid II flippase
MPFSTRGSSTNSIRLDTIDARGHQHSALKGKYLIGEAQALRYRSVHWRVLSNTATVGVFSAVAKVAGAAKIIVTARYFGTSDALDAFLIAFLLPSFFADVVAGCLTPSILPVLARVRASGGEGGAARLARTALTFGIAAMAAIGLALAAGGQFVLPLLGSSFSPDKLRLTAKLQWSLLFWLPVSACIATWRAVLNARGSFALPAIAPITTPVLTMLALAAFAPRFGVYALSIGTLAGVLAETALLAGAVRRYGYSVTPAWDGWTPEISRIWKQYAPLVAGTVISSACVIVDQSVAAALGNGSVSALAYGNRFVAVLVAIATTATGTAALPVFSELAAKRNWARLRTSALMYAGIAFAAGVPIALVFIAWSEPLIRIFLERGAFDTRATYLVAYIQRFALIQLPFALGLSLLIKLAAALESSSMLARVAVVGFVANLIADVLLARWMGIAGIALATAAVQALSLLALLALLLRRKWA